MKRKVTRQMHAFLTNGREVIAVFEALVVRDANYGADADGNRGIQEDSLDGVAMLDEPDAIDGAPLTEAERHEADEALLKTADEYAWNVAMDDDIAESMGGDES